MSSLHPVPGEGGSLEIVGATCPSALQRLRTTCPARKRGTPCMTTGCLLVGKPLSASGSAIEHRNIPSDTLVQFHSNAARIIWSGPACRRQSGAKWITIHPHRSIRLRTHQNPLYQLAPLMHPWRTVSQPNSHIRHFEELSCQFFSP